MKLGGNVAGILNTIKINKILSVFDTRTRLPNTYFPKLNLLSGHDGDVITMNLLLNISSSKCVEEQWRKGNTSALNC